MSLFSCEMGGKKEGDENAHSDCVRVSKRMTWRGVCLRSGLSSLLVRAFLLKKQSAGEGESSSPPGMGRGRKRAVLDARAPTATLAPAAPASSFSSSSLSAAPR